MSRIVRKLQKIFALSASNNGQFGSGQTGAKVTTSDLTVIQALSAWGNGWLDATISAQQLPPLEEMQGIQYVVTSQLAYLFQDGIPEYDSATTYYINSIVKKSGTYELYGSVTNTNVGNALTSTANWVFLIDLQQPVKISMGLSSTAPNRHITIKGDTLAKTSGATFLGDRYFRIYKEFWDNVSTPSTNTVAVVAGGLGANAAADWAANKAMTLPNFTNMSPMQVGSYLSYAGQMSGALTVAAGGSLTLNSVTLSASNMANLSATVYNGVVSNSSTGPVSSSQNHAGYSPDTITTTTGGGGSFTPTGSISGSATSVVHPVFGVYYYINE